MSQPKQATASVHASVGAVDSPPALSWQRSLFISFTESATSARSGAKIWTHAADEIAASVRRHDAHTLCSVHPFSPGARTSRRAILLLERH